MIELTMKPEPKPKDKVEWHLPGKKAGQESIQTQEVSDEEATAYEETRGTEKNEETSQKNEERQKSDTVTKVSSSRTTQTRPNFLAILCGALISMSLSGALIIYSIYFEYVFNVSGSVTSYFPWRWNQIYNSSSAAFELFLISIAISSMVFCASLVTMVKIRTRTVSTEQDDLQQVQPPVQMHEMENDSTPTEIAKDIRRESVGIDELIAELNRSRLRLSILDQAKKAERAHILQVEAELRNKMESSGYPLSITPRRPINTNIEKDSEQSSVKNQGESLSEEERKSALEKRLEKRGKPNKLSAELHHAAEDLDDTAEQQEPIVAPS